MEVGVKEILFLKDGFRQLFEKIFSLVDNTIPTKEDAIMEIKPNQTNRIKILGIKKEILNLICNGLTTKKIAHKMGISFRTIDRYRSEMLKDTNTKNVVHLVVFAIKNGLIKLENIDPIIPYKY